LVDARDFAVARVRKAIFDATGIPEAHILVQATHTHSGPKSASVSGEFAIGKLPSAG
jgi:hypothetical protein